MKKRVESAADLDAFANGKTWSGWLRVVVSGLFCAQMLAVLSASAGQFPRTSMLLHRISAGFEEYYGLTYQGWDYGYYAPTPAPTPVVTAELTYRDGRIETLRLPQPGLWPRLRFQRRLALANQLWTDSAPLRGMQGPEENYESKWGKSYARHICKTYSCERVSLYVRLHLIPDPDALIEAPRRGGNPRVDLDDESFFGPKVRVGDYTCEGL